MHTVLVLAPSTQTTLVFAGSRCVRVLTWCVRVSGLTISAEGNGVELWRGRTYSRGDVVLGGGGGRGERGEGE